LIGFVFYVPDIYKKYNKEIAEFLGVGDKNDPQENRPDTDKKEITPVSAYYQIGGQNAFKFNELSISNVSLSPDKIFSLTITVDDSIDLDTAGYYVEFFKNKETFVGRRSLLGRVTKTKPFTLDISNMDVDSTTYYVLSHVSDSSIKDNYKPASDESGLTTFTCQLKDTSYDYDFYMRKLTKVSKKISYTNTDANLYAQELLKFQKLKKEYDEYRGVTSSIVDNSSSLIFLTEFDYGEVSNFNRIKDNHLYEKGTLDYVILFKMEAEGYVCK
ncbi:MAG TPA: hypothetical protein DCY94_02505, partial [Firmicutes bacterium]|nr:hypothetical protein [Bacillota bacterium]